jgi:hypothetical protein
VIPSLVAGVIGSAPTLYLIYGYLFTKNMGFENDSIIPAGGAIVEAVCLGLFIPLISAIVPIRVALSKNLGDSLNY